MQEVAKVVVMPNGMDSLSLRTRISQGVSAPCTPASGPTSLPQFPYLIPGRRTQCPTALERGCGMLSSPALRSQARSQPRPRRAGQMPTSRLGPRSVGQGHEGQALPSPR